MYGGVGKKSRIELLGNAQDLCCLKHIEVHLGMRFFSNTLNLFIGFLIMELII